MNDFQKAEEWTKRGKKFTVLVKHWTRPEISGSDYHYPEKHCWNVYALVLKGHPWFEKVDPKAYSWECGFPFDFHGGATYLEPLWNKEGEVTGYKIGNDYLHHGDDGFEEAATPEEAWVVFAEAKGLFEAMAEAEAPHE